MLEGPRLDQRLAQPPALQPSSARRNAAQEPSQGVKLECVFGECTLKFCFTERWEEFTRACRESSQEDENNEGNGQCVCYLQPFDFSSLGVKQEASTRGVFKDFEPSTGSPRHWNRVRERDSVRPLGLRADELERLTSPWPGDVEDQRGNVLGEDEEISSPGSSSKKAFLASFCHICHFCS